MMKCIRKIVFIALGVSLPAWANASMSCRAPDDSFRQSVVKIHGDTGNVASGVVVAKGYLLTAAHVVVDAHKIEIEVPGRRVKAYVTMFDEVSDLALLSADTSGLKPLPLGFDVPEHDSPVWAVGYPLGGHQVATFGFFEGMFDGGLRTTADVQSGQSGGALVNCRNGRLEVVGVIRGYGAYQTASGVEKIEGFSISVTPEDISALLARFRARLHASR
ncbi:MAG: trypsin-like peptidase domain-containing protein [Gammaproteobacteria bacterium]|nr:trypsin-like peptidase domain-containing protein [Gammaproteobacteria bacterium]